MPTPPTATVYCDYTGAFLPGEMPRQIRFTRLLNNVDVSSTSRWFQATVSGSVTATIAQTGVLTVTALATDSVIQVRSARDNFSLVASVQIVRVLGGTPSGGTGGGSAASTSSFSSFSAVTAATTTSDIVVTAGSGGTVTLTAPLTVITARMAPTGTFPVFGQWYWFNGASYVAVGTEVQSSPDAAVTFDGDIYLRSNGSLSVSTAKTGLTAATAYRFQFWARNGAGTRIMNLSGTATGTGS